MTWCRKLDDEAMYLARNRGKALAAFGTTAPLPSPLKGEDERIGYNEKSYCGIELVCVISSMRILSP
jgi:hypothetical protein